jgi:hypothetical protein
MNISEEALNLTRQMVNETLAKNLRLATVASLITGGDVPSQGHSDMVSSVVLNSMRDFQQEVAAYNLKLATLAAILTGNTPPGHTGHTVQVDGGPNTIKPPVASGPHDF